MKKRKPKKVSMENNTETRNIIPHSPGTEHQVKPSEAEKAFAIFAVGNEWYCINMDSIFEILHDYEITSVSHLPDFYEGSIRFRDETIPVIKLRELLKIESGIADSQVCIISEYEGTKTGFLIDSEIEFVKFHDVQFFALPDCYSSDEAKLFEGIIEYKKKLIGVLKINQVLKVLAERRYDHEDR